MMSLPRGGCFAVGGMVRNQQLLQSAVIVPPLLLLLKHANFIKKRILSRVLFTQRIDSGAGDVDEKACAVVISEFSLAAHHQVQRISI
jgi:hypothetical protein